ncbi:hypothetical protein ABE494_10000 [Stenotrophomonas lactitubi]|uniref:hypothetical protein n=1 Tax=Stenotrophomonas lactitubi TaxID=2045214 RepID=UPI003207D834
MTTTEFITFGTVIFAGISAICAAATAFVTTFAMKGARRDQESKQMLEQAVISLERAYDALVTGSEAEGPPVADRTSWLSAARLLTQYQSIKGLVTSKAHKLVLEEQEEYWRHRFYLLLRPLTGARGAGYYGKRASSEQAEEHIEPMSAVVIHTFAKWPEDKADPLGTLQRGKVDPDAKFLQGNIGLRRYLDDHGYIPATGQK